jgi:transcriptional regulator with XRE-family HTH domain
VNSLSDCLKQYRKEHDLSLRAFAEQCGLSHVYIINLEKRFDPRSGKENKPTLSVIEQIAHGMGRSVESLLELIIEVISVENLNEEHKSTVKDMINYFRQTEKQEEEEILLQDILPAEMNDDLVLFVKNAENIPYVSLAKDIKESGVSTHIISQIAKEWRDK